MPVRNPMLKENLCDNPNAIAAYLTEIFEENDLKSILEALKLVMRAQNVLALAESTGMRRDGLYKTFNGRKDAQISRVLGLFEGLGVRVEVRPLPVRKKTPRPKLGRPLSSSSKRAAKAQNAPKSPAGD